MTMNFLNSDWFRRFIASSNRTTCPPRNFAREVNKSHVAVSTDINQSEAFLPTNFGNQQTTVSKQK